MKIKLSLLLAVLIAIAPTFLKAQGLGNYPFGPFDSYGFDTINRGNLNPMFGIPVFSKPGRGGTNFSYALTYNGLIWTPVTASGSTVWTPAPEWGWIDSTNVLRGYVTYHLTTTSCTIPPHGLIGVKETFSGYTFYDQHGQSHPINYTYTSACNSGFTDSSSATYVLTDNSGLTIYRTGSTFIVFAPSGSQSTVHAYVSFNGSRPTSPGSATYEDTNGNEITASSSGIFTDTMGMTALTVSGSGTASSPEVFTYTDSNNNPQTVTVNYTNFTVTTNFGVSGVSEYSQTNIPLVTSIVYSADTSSYSFTYEPTSVGSSSVTGRLASVTLRTGGVISYSYTGGSNGIEPDGTTSGLTRTTSDGTYTYSRSGITTTASQTQKLDDYGNATVSQFLINSGNFYETDNAVYQGSATGTPLLENQTCYIASASPCTTSSMTSPPEYVYTNLLENGSATDSTVTQFTGPELVSSVSDDRGLHSYTYQTFTGPYSIPFYRLATDTEQGGSTVAFKITNSYDGSTPTPTSGLPNHVSVGSARGNLTSQTAKPRISTTLTRTLAYDDAGQVLSQTDWNSNATTFQYDPSTDTLLTQATLPNSLYTTYTFDQNTGLLSNSYDLNRKQTFYTYDGLLRPTAITYPTGGGSVGYTYSSPTTTQYNVLHSGTANFDTITYVVDGYGRPYTTTQADNSTGGNETVTYAYDGDGRTYSVTNPERSSSSTTDGTTIYTYDGANRLLNVQEPDTSNISYAYSTGFNVVVTDEQLKQKQYTTDAFGRIHSVTEPDPITGILTGSSLITSYTLDALDHLVSVTQKGGSTTSSQWRTRSFGYNPAGQLESEGSQEQGSTLFSYVNGSSVACSGSITLPCTRTDAIGTSTTYTYDSLNRVTGKSYSDGTASVSYAYDQTSANGLTIANGAGLRTSMSDASGTSTWSFNPMGWILTDQRQLNSVTKTAYYTYNLDGTPYTMQDFAGNAVSYGYNSADQLTSLTDSGSSVAYLSSLTYSPGGTLTGGTLGNGAALVNTFNPRFQPTSLTALVSGTTIFGLNYGYGTAGYDNGSIASITNSLNSARSQAYTYDYLNRVSTAQAGTLWGYGYGYDNWGNLLSMTPASGVSNSETSLNVTSNYANQLQATGFSYDSDGRMTGDNNGNSYTYDAEGRIHTVNGYTYTYDGDGQRVEKTDGSTGILYWPDLNGKAAEETDLSGTTVVRNVYAGNTQIARADSSGNWSYFLHDHLGTPRMVLDASGSVLNDTDYYPFGGLAYNSGSTSNLYGFTGYENDSESSTSYAVFRNESATLGRFLRPDPYDGSYNLADPQSLNRYSYVGNRSLSFTDPFGLEDDDDGDGGGGSPIGWYTDQNGNYYYWDGQDLTPASQLAGANVGGCTLAENCGTYSSFTPWTAPTTNTNLPKQQSSPYTPQQYHHDECVNGVVEASVGTVFSALFVGVAIYALPDAAASVAIDTGLEAGMTATHMLSAGGALLAAPFTLAATGFTTIAENCWSQ